MALRPEERVIPVLERWLKPGIFERFIDAFLQILVDEWRSCAAARMADHTLALALAAQGRRRSLGAAGASALAVLEGAKTLPGQAAAARRPGARAIPT